MIHCLLTINGIENVRASPAGTFDGIAVYIINKRADSPYALCVAFAFDLNGRTVLALTDTKAALESWKADPAKLRASYDATVATFANHADIMAQLHKGVNLHPWIIAGLVAGGFPGAEAAALAWRTARAKENAARHAEIDTYRANKAAAAAAKYQAAQTAFLQGGVDVAGEDVYRMTREYVPSIHPRSAGALRKLVRVRYIDPPAYDLTIRGGKCNAPTFLSISRTLWQVRNAMLNAKLTAGQSGVA